MSVDRENKFTTYLSLDVHIHSINFTFRVISCNIIWFEEVTSAHNGPRVVNIHSTSCHRLLLPRSNYVTSSILNDSNEINASSLTNNRRKPKIFVKALASRKPDVMISHFRSTVTAIPHYAVYIRCPFCRQHSAIARHGCAMRMILSAV